MDTDSFIYSIKTDDVIKALLKMYLPVPVVSPNNERCHHRRMFLYQFGKLIS